MALVQNRLKMREIYNRHGFEEVRKGLNVKC